MPFQFRHTYNTLQRKYMTLRKATSQYTKMQIYNKTTYTQEHLKSIPFKEVKFDLVTLNEGVKLEKLRLKGFVFHMHLGMSRDTTLTMYNYTCMEFLEALETVLYNGISIIPPLIASYHQYACFTIQVQYGHLAISCLVTSLQCIKLSLQTSIIPLT